MTKTTNIKIKQETHRRLLAYGKKNETWDQLFLRLLAEASRAPRPEPDERA